MQRCFLRIFLVLPVMLVLMLHHFLQDVLNVQLVTMPRL